MSETLALPAWQYDAPRLSPYRTCTVGETDSYYVDLCPMLYNHRIVLTPKGNSAIYVVGWCYPSAEAAFAAMAIWQNPEKDLPVGFIKQVGLFPWPN